MGIEKTAGSVGNSIRCNLLGSGKLETLNDIDSCKEYFINTVLDHNKYCFHTSKNKMDYYIDGVSRLKTVDEFKRYIFQIYSAAKNY